MKHLAPFFGGRRMAGITAADVHGLCRASPAAGHRRVERRLYFIDARAEGRTNEVVFSVKGGKAASCGVILRTQCAIRGSGA
jgi:hypothetical protein